MVSNKIATTYRFASRMSRVGVSAIREILKVAERPEVISFAGGLPAPETFPVEAFAEALALVLGETGPAVMQYSTTEGWQPLRAWIAARMQHRGIGAPADQILITHGSQQGIDLVAKVFLDPGDKIIVENPSYLAALQAFSSYEASFIAIESDDDGMRVDQVEDSLRRWQAKLIYLVSDFHNPKGTTLSRERREHLIALSRRYRIPIVEDDPYFETRFAGEFPRPLAAMDEDGLVIYLSTFSKTLSPGMRLGWAVASGEVIHALIMAKQASDLHTNTIVQRAVARMLVDFDYEAHLLKIRKIYSERRQAMLEALEEYFPAGSSWTKPEGGMFTWVRLPERIDAEHLLEQAIQQNVAFVPGAHFFATNPCRNFIRLNFSNSQPDKIREGVGRLGDALKETMQFA